MRSKQLALVHKQKLFHESTALGRMMNLVLYTHTLQKYSGEMVLNEASYQKCYSIYQLRMPIHT